MTSTGEAAPSRRPVATDTAPCVCGAHHPTPVDTVVADASALDELGEFVAARWQHPFVVMDANTADAFGSSVLTELARLRPASLCFPEREGLRADERAVATLSEALAASGSDAMIAVGSGVVTDVTRYVASTSGHEFVSVPTAASMDGYASSVAAMEFGGIRATFPASAPIAIFADPSVAASAPTELTRAGIGDLLAKATARVDWLASAALYGEELCPLVERRLADAVSTVVAHVDEVLARSPMAVAGLLGALVESGRAMAMVGSSRPASGCEHHASHFWDLLAARGERPHHSHGLQVGYATHFAARLQRFAFAGGIPSLVEPAPIVFGGDEARHWLAGHVDELEAVASEKRRFTDEHRHNWPASAGAWDEVCARLGEAIAVFPAVEGALTAAGIPDRKGLFDVEETTLKATFRFANRIRARYTVLDLIEGQGLTDEAIDRLIA